MMEKVIKKDVNQQEMALSYRPITNKKKLKQNYEYINQNYYHFRNRFDACAYLRIWIKIKKKTQA